MNEAFISITEKKISLLAVAFAGMRIVWFQKNPPD